MLSVPIFPHFNHDSREWMQSGVGDIFGRQAKVKFWHSNFAYIVNSISTSHKWIGNKKTQQTLHLFLDLNPLMLDVVDAKWMCLFSLTSFDRHFFSVEAFFLEFFRIQYEIGERDHVMRHRWFIASFCKLKRFYDDRRCMYPLHRNSNFSQFRH